MRILTKPYQDSGYRRFDNLTVVRHSPTFAKAPRAAMMRCDHPVIELATQLAINPQAIEEAIRRRDGFRIGGRFVEAAEISPKSEARGTDGFTFKNKKAAFAKLLELA